MSDWEQAAITAFREVSPRISIDGCLFHYTKRIWSKVQKNFHAFVDGHSVLPAPLIVTTLNLIATPSLETNQASMLAKLKKYVKKYWLT